MSTKSKRPTVKDVALLAEVSPATVSMILKGRAGVSFSADTVKRVREAAAQLGYKRPGSSSSGLFDRPTIAIFITLITGSYYTHIAQAITQKAHEAGYDTIVLETHRNPQRELRLMHMVSQSGAAGIVFTVTPINTSYATTLAALMPTVLISNRQMNLPIDTITTDDHRVGALVANHLLELGHTNIGFIEMARNWQGVKQNMRLKGAQDAFIAYPEAKLSIYSTPAPDTLMPGSFIESRVLARKAAKQALDTNPTLTAFIGVSDYVAYGVIDTLVENHFLIPDDYSVCACDNLFASSLPGVSLTTVDRHPAQTGVNSFELLLQKIQRLNKDEEEPARVTTVEYMSNLIIRNSTAPPRKG